MPLSEDHTPIQSPDSGAGPDCERRRPEPHSCGPLLRRRTRFLRRSDRPLLRYAGPPRDTGRRCDRHWRCSRPRDSARLHPWRTSSQKPYRTNSATADVDLAQQCAPLLIDSRRFRVHSVRHRTSCSDERCRGAGSDPTSNASCSFSREVRANRLTERDRHPRSVARCSIGVGLPQSSAAKFSGSSKRPACAKPHGCRAAKQSQKGKTMNAIYVIVALILAALILSAMSARIIKQYERVVVFEFGKVKGEARGPGLIFIFPFVDRVHRVSLGSSRCQSSPRASLQGQREHRRVRGGLLPGGGSDPISGRDRERAVRDQPDRADHPSRGGGASHAR